MVKNALYVDSTIVRMKGQVFITDQQV